MPLFLFSLLTGCTRKHINFLNNFFLIRGGEKKREKVYEGRGCVLRCAVLLCAFECRQPLLSECHTYLHIKGSDVIHPLQIISFGVLNSFRLASSSLRQSMAPSQVSGKKMRTLLFGVILGIFAVVHSVTSNDLSQDIYLEAVTEGYLIDMPDIFSPRSTVLSKRPETTEGPQQPSSESEKSDMFEGSRDAINKSMKILFSQHGSDHHESTTQSAEHNHSSQQPLTESKESDMFEGSRDTSDKFLTTLFPQHGESTTHTETTESMIEGSGEFTIFFQDSGEHITTTQSSISTETTESMTEGSGEFTTFLQDNGEHITTTQSSISTETTESMIEGSGEFTTFLQDKGESFTTTENSTSIVSVTETEGSGDVGSADEGKMSPVSTTQTSSLTRNKAGRGLIPSSNESEPGVPETKHPQTHQDIAPSSQSANQGTPGWIIIVAFIVGVAALVMLCVAIATRDKWNGPNQASKLETKTKSSNQQRELEMETFLQKDQPRENGEAAEFTVIQLDDLPDQYSSQ